MFRRRGFIDLYGLCYKVVDCRGEVTSTSQQYSAPAHAMAAARKRATAEHRKLRSRRVIGVKP